MLQTVTSSVKGIKGVKGCVVHPSKVNAPYALTFFMVGCCDMWD